MSSNAFLTPERLQVGQRPAKMPPPPGLLGTPGGAPPESATPVGSDGGELMTMRGVASATGVLMSLLMVAAFFGWNMVTVENGAVTAFPGWLMGLVAVGIGLVAASYFMPHLAKILGPAYAIVEGLVIGAFTRIYEVQFEGIALQAALVTIAVFLAMLFLYGTRIIKVTDGLRRGIVAATMGVMAVYLFQFVANLLGFGFTVPYLHDSGPIGIAISLFLVGLAAFNYLVDFDFVERATKAGAPRDMEWVAAFGLLMTTVWLYFEVLRLLAKLRD